MMANFLRFQLTFCLTFQSTFQSISQSIWWLVLGQLLRFGFLQWLQRLRCLQCSQRLRFRPYGVWMDYLIGLHRMRSPCFTHSDLSAARFTHSSRSCFLANQQPLISSIISSIAYLLTHLITAIYVQININFEVDLNVKFKIKFKVKLAEVIVILLQLVQRTIQVFKSQLLNPKTPLSLLT